MKFFALRSICFSLFFVLATSFCARGFSYDLKKDEIRAVIKTLASFKDRTTGTKGCKKTADFIRQKFESLEPQDIGSMKFTLPVRVMTQSRIVINGISFALDPLRTNAITPQTIGPDGLSGPVIYVGFGELSDFNGKNIDGSILLMEFDSGKNWLNAANFGAKAVIYIEKGEPGRMFFEDKKELSPINFPRFIIPESKAAKIFKNYKQADNGPVCPQATLFSDVKWERVQAENIYCVIAGTDPRLKEELIIAHAFYDTTSYVFGKSPGSDEGLSLATLLSLGNFLKKNPPKRSVMLLATSGHAQSLHGMREAIWAIRSKSKNLRKEQKRLKKIKKESRKMIKVLQRAFKTGKINENTRKNLHKAIEERIKTEIDFISRKLVELRMAEKADKQAIKKLAKKRMLFRRLGWKNDLAGLGDDEKEAVKYLIPKALSDYKAVFRDAKIQLRNLKSAKKFRSIVKDRELSALVSLHLSSHGDGVGAFNYGWLYPIKPHINRVGPYSLINEILFKAGKFSAKDVVKNVVKDVVKNVVKYMDTLRPSPLRSWQSYFPDTPPLGGEVAALAGYLGFTLATVDDARLFWGTPHDIPEKMNMEYATAQAKRVISLVSALAKAPELYSGSVPRNGFATITARVKLLRHGELFPDQPAPDTMILAYQADGKYHAITDTNGIFRIKGVATKKLVLGKVIIEGYKFDKKTGKAILAIDKKQTGKPAYRVKMQRHNMETDLVMFAAKQTTIFNLFEPRTFRYMTKIQLIDGRREALPLRYWYSRIDTRSSTISSIYLEPGTYLKLTHSDNILNRKMILINADKDNPTGTGYKIDDWPLLNLTSFRTAKDMWALLGPRIKNLETHGIVDQRIDELKKQGTQALENAGQFLKERQYDRFTEEALKSWALASRVYNQVEKTQRDVLFGVLFYIALFVPFAFCMERLLFSFTDIHRRIVAFLCILLVVIWVIYNVHPAFQLAYSPTVVILAFFIMGLSLMVTLIIFFRFEQEMILLQRRAKQMRTEEISRWKAFVASFFLGVSNLKRRRLRTALTCATLIILTFTIMSFTSVKSTRLHTKFLYKDKAPYKGFMLKNINWQDLPPNALGIVENAFEGEGAVVPRVWLEDPDKTKAVPIPIYYGDKYYQARGMTGLSYREPYVTALDDKILVAGRWFDSSDKYSVILPLQMAKALGIGPENLDNAKVTIWGFPMKVTGIFSGEKLRKYNDLDGEILTPVTFPNEMATEMTEVEMDAMESGDDIRTFQSRYEHIRANLTVIVPAKTLLAEGGHLKAVAIRLSDPDLIPSVAKKLVDRFGLTLFSGEPDGTFMYTASDTLNYSGVPNVMIPMIISVLIVLNTMIGSVYERKREIAIYTSVGLAPSHVSFLFIAEALAFAVISVVLGYLVAQVSSGFFAGTALWAGITVNYSSLVGVASMVLVIIVVLVSVIYPSKVAANIAIPDVNRLWALPEVSEDTIELVLPFLVKYHEHDSVAGFLLSYFKGHEDISHGIFSTGKITTKFTCPAMPKGMDELVSCDDINCIKTDVRVWLAPFDLGIMQQVEIEICPSVENKGFLEIGIKLKRETGEANAWKRINKAFLNELRKQLLIWRSLSDSAKREYEKVISEQSWG